MSYTQQGYTHTRTARQKKTQKQICQELNTRNETYRLYQCLEVFSTTVIPNILGLNSSFILKSVLSAKQAFN